LLDAPLCLLASPRNADRAQLMQLA
jgi:hypothetical protein